MSTTLKCWYAIEVVVYFQLYPAILEIGGLSFDDFTIFFSAAVLTIA